MSSSGGEDYDSSDEEEDEGPVELHNDGQTYEVAGVGRPIIHVEEESSIPQIRWKVKWPSTKKNQKHEWTAEPFQLISHLKAAQ